MKTNTIKVLDYGYVTLHNVSSLTRRPDQLFDADLRDCAISARMSFGKTQDERSRDQDMKLVKYLFEHQHNTPIEMIEVWLEMKLPIFVARQFVRHRTATINEISGRYVTLPEEWYIPGTVGGKAPNAKQGQADNLSEGEQTSFKRDLERLCQQSYNTYIDAINHGVAPEHARMLLHVNHYTRWIWKQDLSNMLRFIRLREDNHAQVEAQLYARAIRELLCDALPGLDQLIEVK